MADTEVFHAKISATDDASQTIDKIKTQLHALGHEAERAGHATEHMGHHHMWEALSEHIDLTKEHFSGLHASIGEVGDSVTELLPAFAAFGAGATLVGLFETVEKTAEAYGELAHTAISLGIATEELHQLNIMAKLTDTSVEAMDIGFNKFNRTIGQVAAGANKDAAAALAHAGISIRDASGHLKTADELLPEVAEAFAHTSDAAVRTRAAFALFGKGGAELIPMLMRGKEGLEEVRKEAEHFGVNLKPYGEGLDRYNESMHKLSASTEGFTQILGGMMAPVLQPLVDDASEYVVTHREKIASAIVHGVRDIRDELVQVPWRKYGEEMLWAGHVAHELVDDIGGPKVAIEGLAAVMALKGVLFLVEPIRETVELTASVAKLIIKLGGVAAAYAGIGTAATAAAVAEEAAAAGHIGKVARVATAAELAVASGATAAPIAAAKYGPAAGMRAVETARDAALANEAAKDAQNGVLAGRGRFGALVWLSALIDASTRDIAPTQELLARVPGLRGTMTPEQIAALPHEEASWATKHISAVDYVPDHMPKFDLVPPMLRAASPQLASYDFDAPSAWASFSAAPAPNQGGQSSQPVQADLQGRVDVNIDLTGAPPGTTTQTTVTGSPLITPRISTGRAWNDDPFALNF